MENGKVGLVTLVLIINLILVVSNRATMNLYIQSILPEMMLYRISRIEGLFLLRLGF